MSTIIFSPVEEIIADIAAGKIVIVADDPSRENEADLVCAASKATPEIIAFMASHGRGLICAPITTKQAESLDLPQMSRRNTEALKTAFTISVDAAKGITTGISAADRARTVNLLADPDTKPDALVKPGHIFPLQSVDGGVLRRAGHTEAATDLAMLAGLEPAGVICEIMHENGNMATVGDLGDYQKQHDLKACTIAQIIIHRRNHEKLVHCTEIIKLPTDFGEFNCHLYEIDVDGTHHLALTRGEISADKPVTVRVHSECLTGDAFMSRRCDCGGQLHQAMEQIAKEGGVLLYLRQEGRGIGLPAKIKAYKLQEHGFDTVEANEELGYGADLRDYGVGAQILHDLGVRKMRLLTNNPKKMIGLEGYGLEITEQLPIRQPSNPDNEKYLKTKKDRMGHSL
ncbi:MAG: 3,4-dihydroxy 2-butanone 4-phosphate synthase/GTP cyclohydrolase II [Rubritalea sp.]|jgi:3,4-dihydroxy 2-butanone 4-phosphate synthase/GTP cyclohydrolase II|tara:strand:+ start:3741 stop:4940 length:1200 start_codon:yes stop_codon:yes gene_type:complete